MWFTDFEIGSGDCQFDWLEIVDKDGKVILDKSCGDEAPVEELESISNWVTITFKSGDSVIKRGFSLSWEEVVPQPTKSTYVFSPDYEEGLYPDNTDMTYELQGENPDYLIHIIFLYFSFFACLIFGCYYWVTIEDDEEDTLMRKTCGSTVPAVLNEGNNKVTVIFHSNESISMRGFKLEWRIYVVD